MKKFLLKRKKIARYYDSVFKSDPIIKTPINSINVTHAYHLYPLQINFEICKVKKKELFKIMYNYGFNLQVHYIPVHLQPYYAKRYEYKRPELQNSETFYEREISIPIYPDLNISTQKLFIRTLLKVLHD